VLDILERISRFCQRKRAAKTFQKVRMTAPLKYVYSDEVVVVSQVHHNAINMAILALKSFMLSLGKGRIEVINDGSLTQDDIEQLNYHFPKITVVDIASIPLGSCPQGGTWERLVHILSLTKHSYVIQVDSDTLTMGPVDDVYNSIVSNQAFLIGEPSWSKAIPVEYMSRYSNKLDSTHIQVLSEQKLNRLESIPLKQYARGCSAFTGFPKGFLLMENLEAFSVEMESLIGKQKWREWGSEQLSSNVMLSLCPDVKILPWPKYINFGFPFKNGKYDNLASYINQTSVFHFIGTNRFSRGVYRRMANKVIVELS